MKDKVIQKTIKALIFVLGMGLGYAVAYLAIEYLSIINSEIVETRQIRWSIYAVMLMLGLVLGHFSYRPIIAVFSRIENNIDKKWKNMNTVQLTITIIGLVIGLIIATLVTQLFHFFSNSIFSATISAIIYILLGYIGFTIAYKRSKDFNKQIPSSRNERFFRKLGRADNEERQNFENNKILDTSVIIDGRVLDIAKTGFIEGKLIIPRGVLLELQHIADNSDTTRRNKGRRGLSIVMKMQEEMPERVIIEETEFKDIIEVDAQILRIAQDKNAAIITNDYNLNKLANVTGINVLNINELTNAVKPTLLKDEKITVEVLKEGKGTGQGIAYMADGTMIVIDGGKEFVDQSIEVTVTSILQTSAGRMIFAKV